MKFLHNWKAILNTMSVITGAVGTGMLFIFPPVGGVLLGVSGLAAGAANIPRPEDKEAIKAWAGGMKSSADSVIENARKFDSKTPPPLPEKK